MGENLVDLFKYQEFWDRHLPPWAGDTGRQEAEPASQAGGACEAPCNPIQASGSYWSMNSMLELFFFFSPKKTILGIVSFRSVNLNTPFFQGLTSLPGLVS